MDCIDSYDRRLNMRRAPRILIPVLFVIGCSEPNSISPASSSAPTSTAVPSNDSKKVDVKVRTPGVSVDIHKPTNGKTDVQIERKAP